MNKTILAIPSLIFTSMTIAASNHAVVASPFNTIEDKIYQQQPIKTAALPKPDLSLKEIKALSAAAKKQAATKLAAIPKPDMQIKPRVKLAAIPKPNLQKVNLAPTLTAALPTDAIKFASRSTKPALLDRPFEQPKLVWTKHATPGAGSLLLPMAASFHNQQIFSVGADGKIAAINADNGKKLWLTSTRYPITTAAVVGDNNIFVGTDNALLLALDPQTHKVVFAKQLSNSVLAAPAVSAGIVYAKTLDDHLYAFAQKDGHVLWAFSQDAPGLTNRQSSTPVVVGDRLIAGLSNGKLVALNRKTGAVIWQRQVTYPDGDSDIARMVDIDITPVIANDRVFASNIKGRLAAYDIENGKQYWQQNMGELVGMAYGENTLYLTSKTGDVYALNPQFGGNLWHNDNFKGSALSAPTVVGNHLVFADSKGVAHWLQLEDGKEVATVAFGKHPVMAAPLAIADDVYLQTVSGETIKIS